MSKWIMIRRRLQASYQPRQVSALERYGCRWRVAISWRYTLPTVGQMYEAPGQE